MAKKITRIVLTGGPAAGKTTLISRILKEFKQDDGWKVITVPETATDLITGFGIKPFGNCISMYDFQYFVIEDQLHKDRLALKAAQMVPEENVLIIYDRALLDDKAYITDEEFREVLASFGRTEEEVMGYYDAVLHLVSCAKGAEFAYNFGNEARYEPLEVAREKDDLTLRAWSKHPNLRVIDNSVNFEDKIARGLRAIYETIGEPVPEEVWHKYLIELPDVAKLVERYRAAGIDMMQTYLSQTSPSDGSAASAASALRLNASAQKTARKNRRKAISPILFSFICITITQNREKCNFRAKNGGLPHLSGYGIMNLYHIVYGGTAWVDFPTSCLPVTLTIR